MLIVVYGMKIDRLLDMLVEAAAQSEKCSSHSFPLTIVFVERKVQSQCPYAFTLLFMLHHSSFSATSGNIRLEV